MKSFTQLSNNFVTYSQNATTANATLGKQMINDAHRYLLQKYFNNEFTTTCRGVSQQQFYPLPSNYSKLKTVTITQGSLKWTPEEILTRQEWDKLNVFPYYADIPKNFFIYDSNTIGIWPIPSTGSTVVNYTGLSNPIGFVAGDTVTDGTTTGTVLSVSAVSATAGSIIISIPASSYGALFLTSGVMTDSTSGYIATIGSTIVTKGNLITFNYKGRVPDMTIADIGVSPAGTCTTVSGNPLITSCSQDILTSTLAVAGNATNLNLWIQPTIPKGDGNWYQVNSIQSNSALTLANTYSGVSSVTVGFTLGQMPLLLEDFHDLLVYRPLMIYFSSINKDSEKAGQFKSLYEEGEKRLAEYSGSKVFDVNLGRRPSNLNPNLFYLG
jgi:hypothetical protein